MDAEKTNQALYQKMSAEQERYRHGLLAQTPEEVLDHAFEYTIRQDILRAMEGLDLPGPEAAALLKSPSPLADIYQDFRELETDHMADVRKCIASRAGQLLEKRREVVRAVPLYMGSAEHAEAHGELKLFQASHAANIACRDAIDAAIREGYDGMHLRVDVTGVLAEFGPERVSHVLAAALLAKTWDQRISADNQAWAASVPMPDTGTGHRDCILQSHPMLLNQFVRRVRKEMDAMKQQAEKKPSIKAQLAEKPVPGGHLAKPKDKGVR